MDKVATTGLTVPIVPPENRPLAPDSGSASETSPKAGSSSGKGGKAKAKAKFGAQAKGVVEDSGASANGAGAEATPSASGQSAKGQESLIAEAAKLLKNVSLKPVRVAEGDSFGEVNIDGSWLLSAITGPSDVSFALLDSGATNALRPAEAGELEQGRIIKVDLASGVAKS